MENLLTDLAAHPLFTLFGGLLLIFVLATIGSLWTGEFKLVINGKLITSPPNTLRVKVRKLE